jgi:hypothetical protein
MAPMVSSSGVVTDRAEDIQKGVWPHGRWERGRPGAGDRQQRGPAMGRGTYTGKRRGRGGEAGAEDGEVWPGRVSVHAADHRIVAHAKAAIRWRPGACAGSRQAFSTSWPCGSQDSMGASRHSGPAVASWSRLPDDLQNGGRPLSWLVQFSYESNGSNSRGPLI